MKRLPLVLLLVAVLSVAFASSAFAHEYDRNDTDCPWRIAAYVLHPVGVALEWTITRPVHWLVMQPGFCYVFGHEPQPGKGTKVNRIKDTPEADEADAASRKAEPQAPEKIHQARETEPEKKAAPANVVG